MPVTLKKSLLLCLLSLGAVACGPVTHQTETESQDNENIIGGSTVESRNTKASKSIVYLRIKDASNIQMSACTGTLIGPNTVLTAAHCVDSSKYKGKIKIEVVFTNNSKTKNAPVRTSNWFATHPQFNSIPYETYEWVFNESSRQYDKRPVFLPGKNYDHDIGVVVFSGSIPAGYGPVAIDTDKTRDYSGASDYAYGYGYNVDYGDPIPAGRQTLGILKKGEMVVGDFSLSQHIYWADPVKGAFTCQGDSGGPHFYNQDGVLKVIGVTSCGSGDYAPEKKKSCLGRAKVTRVAVFSDWIKSTERKLLNQVQ